MLDKVLYLYDLHESASTLVCLLCVKPVTLTLTSLANIVAYSCLGSGVWEELKWLLLSQGLS